MKRSRGKRTQAEWFTYGDIWDEPQLVALNSLTLVPLAGTQPLASITPGGNVAPLVNQQRVTEVDARIQVSVAAAGVSFAGALYTGIGLYLAEWDDDNSIWAQQDPLEPPDAQRMNWMLLKTWGSPSIPIAVVGNGIQSGSHDYSFKQRMNVLCGNGRCLFLALSNSNSSSFSAAFYYNIRLKVANEL